MRDGVKRLLYVEGHDVIRLVLEPPELDVVFKMMAFAKVPSVSMKPRWWRLSCTFEENRVAKIRWRSRCSDEAMVIGL